jgi:hypothetical protein
LWKKAWTFVEIELTSPAVDRPRFKAYRSPLWDHLDAIRKWRQARLTWSEIAERLNAEPYKVGISRSAVHAFFKRVSNRKAAYPLGMQPESPSQQPSSMPVDQPSTGVDLNRPDLLEPQPQKPLPKPWEPTP